MRRIFGTLLGGLCLLSSDALACGGFFCDAPARPIDQAGERIVFAMDREAGKVEMHAQITYTGTAQEFAWLLPVPEVPELFLSTDELFTVLGRNTAPIFQLQTRFEDGCDVDASTDGGGGENSDTAAASDTDGVQVAAQSTLGPYDTVVLRGESTDELLTWLNDNGYYVPDGVAPSMAPYVSAESWFVALRLRKDKDVGDLAPVGLTYSATQPVIPLVLTSIAAADDMPLVPYVFSDGRAVPDNYLHVVIDDLALDWFQQGRNYPATVSLAADVAGGQAFATDFAGSPDAMQGLLFTPSRFDLAALRAETTRVGFLQEVLGQGFVVDTRLIRLLDSFIPGTSEALASGGDTGFGWGGSLDTGAFEDACADDTDADTDGECAPFDAGPIVDALKAEIVDPLEHAEQLFHDHGWVTRLTSSMSPSEMTLDPQFTINPTMDPVAQTRTATFTIPCDPSDVDGVLEVPDGRRLVVPSFSWLEARGMTRDDWFAPFREYPALRIEETSALAPPVVLVDNAASVDDWVTARNAWIDPMGRFLDLGDDDDDDDARTCGCATGAAGGGAMWLVLLGVGAALRRRQD